ncbi:hypothetical protein Nepgr_017595 [Nepenthes gracilis]|uniref:CASP-like protein n=1 Tax=Nepenthes gracilis TaxID=150966 RepID=A0AAD3SRU9_NEPGR|nr:hypothetical protein Nepgr_017595 [Nepenthes gracilis]
MSYLGATVSSLIVVVDRRLRVAELILRILICGLGVLAAALVGSDSQVKVIFTIQKKAKFTDMKALVFLVIANGIAAAYSLLQLLRCIVSISKGTVLFNKLLALIIFSGDQVVAYLTLSAVAAAAQSSVYAKLGQTELQWMKVCEFYGKLCGQVAEGIASAVAVGVCTAVVSVISAYNLFRLYGGSNGGRTARWWPARRKPPPADFHACNLKHERRRF